MTPTPDKYHGQGGTFKTNARGEREVVDQPKSHPDGDMPRDANGKPFEDKIATAPAIPAPGEAPWAADAKKAAELAAAGKTKSGKGD